MATVTDTDGLGQPAESVATNVYVVVVGGDAIGLGQFVQVRPVGGLHANVAELLLLNADSCTLSELEHNDVISGNAEMVGGTSA